MKMIQWCYLRSNQDNDEDVVINGQDAEEDEEKRMIVIMSMMIAEYIFTLNIQMS